jgi:ABC-type sugar transport system ATPase subunit
MNLLEMKDVSKSFSSVKVLHNISLEIQIAAVYVDVLRRKSSKKN